MTLSWNVLACYGLGKKIPEQGIVSLVMVHLRPMREKWIKDHGSGEVEKYIMENGHHGARKLFESPDISKEMWFKAALRREFKSHWWWRAPEKRREKCYNVVNASNTRYSASTWGPQPIMGMPDDLLKSDVHGLYETLDDAHPDALGCRVVERQWSDKWSREKDAAMRSRFASHTWLGTHAIQQAKWYQDIHEGRYFLFFKMNDHLKTKIQNRVGYMDPAVKPSRQFCPEIISEQWENLWLRRFRGKVHTTVSDFNKNVKTCDIMGFFPEQQCASDLLTIDGQGLNHSPGKEVMHIDDMFLKE